mgnify:CR=1 FL=1
MSEPVRGSRVGLFVLGCWLGVELVVCGVPGVLAVELGPVGVLEGVLEVMGLEGVALDWAGLEGVGLAGVLGVGVSEGAGVSSGWEGVGVGQVGVLGVGVSEGAGVSSGWEGVDVGQVGLLGVASSDAGPEGVASDAGPEGVGQVGVLGVGVSEGVDVSSGWEGVGVGHWHWHCSWHAGLAGPVAAWAVPAPASRTMLDAAAARVILVVFFTSDSYAGMDARVRACTGVGESGPAWSVP